MKTKGKFTLGGKQWSVEIVGGIPKVEGLSLEAFLKAHPELLEDAACIGAGVIYGTLPAGSPQIAAHCLQAAKQKNN